MGVLFSTPGSTVCVDPLCSGDEHLIPFSNNSPWLLNQADRHSELILVEVHTHPSDSTATCILNTSTASPYSVVAFHLLFFDGQDANFREFKKKGLP